MKITSQNEVISKYMGHKFDLILRSELVIFDSSMESISHKLSYDKDWKQLMEVVSKIESEFETPTTLPRFNINGHCVNFNVKSFNSITGCYLGSPEYKKRSTKILAVHQVCYDFVEWFNNQ